MSTIKTNSIQPTTTSDTLVVQTGVGSAPRLSITPEGLIQIETGTTVTGVTCDALTVSGASILSGSVTVGNISTSNVSAKINNNYANSNGLEGCVVPLYSRFNTGTTTPLPTGTWFVYLQATENSANDNDTHFTMAKVWVVPSSQFLRFKVLNEVSTTTNTKVQFILSSTSTTTESEGTFTEFTTTEPSPGTAIHVTSATVANMFGSGSSGTHTGVIFAESNTSNGVIYGYAMRIG